MRVAQAGPVRFPSGHVVRVGRASVDNVFGGLFQGLEAISFPVQTHVAMGSSNRLPRGMPRLSCLSPNANARRTTSGSNWVPLAIAGAPGSRLTSHRLHQ
jgi:hypothetical protein